ncbi:MAG: DEAD/DEAH box helicase [Gemmatimonadetes bacterium]|nr:DEAD/DEAH box helicase [Gemmatimonadota bacterium]
MLAESDSLDLDGDEVIVPFDVVLRFLVEDRTLVTRWAPVAPFLLTIDRSGDLATAGFSYRVGWHLGADAVPLERAGAYVRWPPRNQIFRLEPRTAAIVEAMERFNATPPSERTRSAAWSTFGSVRMEAERLGVELDAALRANTVVVPSAVALEMVWHPDATLSFAPRIPELAGDEFRTAFFNNRDVQEVYSISRPDGSRVRVLLSDRQREVLRRMKSVTARRGEAAKKLATQPEEVFDGVLGDVELHYGARVTGIGPIDFGPSPIDPASGGVVGRLAGPREQSTTSPEERASRTPPDSVEAETDEGERVVLPLWSDGSREAMHEAVAAALARGDTSAQIEGHRVRLDAELLASLSSGAARKRATERAYLLIRENEEEGDTFDLGDLASAKGDVAVVEDSLPAALEESVDLKSHQLSGVQWLARCASIPGRTGVLLADDMGLGKTLQVLTFLASAIEHGRTDDSANTGRDGPFRPILIVAPLMLVDTGTWTREMEQRFRWHGAVFRPWHVLHGHGIAEVQLDSDVPDPLGRVRRAPKKLMGFRVVITTYETVVNYQHSLAQQVDGRPIWSMVVTDEAQGYKAMRTKKSHAIKALQPPFQVAATGTPVETRLLDLWNIMDAVQPGLLGSAREFTRRFETPLVSESAAESTVLAELRRELLVGRPNTFLLRRGKEELTDLPPKYERILNCRMGPLELEHEQRLIRDLGAGAGRRSLGVLQELAARSQHPLFGGGSLSLSSADDLVSTSVKLRELVRVLREIAAAREKVLIFALRVPIQQMLSYVIGKKFGIDVSIINGETGRAAAGSSTGAHRRRLLDRFEKSDGFGAIVLSPFVAGVGLTITAANHVIHYGRWWNPAVEGQATDRAYRIGQAKPVTVYYPILRAPEDALPGGTFDEALHSLIMRRRALARDFLHPEAGEGELATELASSLAGGSLAEGDRSTPPSDVAAALAAWHRREGAVPLLVAGVGHAGAAALFVYGRSVLVWPSNPAQISAAVRWSALLPGAIVRRAEALSVVHSVTDGDARAERTREIDNPAMVIELARRAIR